MFSVIRCRPCPEEQRRHTACIILSVQPRIPSHLQWSQPTGSLHVRFLSERLCVSVTFLRAMAYPLTKRALYSEFTVTSTVSPQSLVHNLFPFFFCRVFDQKRSHHLFLPFLRPTFSAHSKCSVLCRTESHCLPCNSSAHENSRLHHSPFR